MNNPLNKNLMPFPEEPIPKQRFTGYWIPVELTKLGLTKIEQFLLSMIDSLESEAPEYCFASNAYLADKMEMSESRVSFYITKLKRMGLIKQVGFNGRRRILRTLKENWYKITEENSKKELCVKTRSDKFKKKNYARSHEPCMRENTNHITKEDNKDCSVIVCAESAPVEPPPRLEKVKIKSVEGKDILVTKESLFQDAILHRKDWTTPEIEKLWEVLAKYDQPVRDLILFCDGTIKNFRKMQSLKKLSLPTSKPRTQKCNSTQNLKKPSENSKESITAKDMLERPFLNFKCPDRGAFKSNNT